MDLDELRRELGLEGPWETRGDGTWVEAGGHDPAAVAPILLAHDARFVTMTATPESGGGFRLIYHWDVDGALLHIAVRTEGSTVSSIAVTCPAADWVEREVRDYYGLVFVGRDDTPPLMLREGDERGLFARTAALGRDADPAETARRSGVGPAPQPPASPSLWPDESRHGASGDAREEER